MPLVPETKMADVGKLISLGNLLARKTMWLVLTTMSATSILSHVFWSLLHDKDCLYMLSSSNIHSLSHFHLQGQHALSSGTSRENTLTLSILTNRVITLFLFSTFDFQQSTTTKMSTPYNHFLPCYTFSERLFLALNTEISSNLRKKQTIEILS